MVASRYPLFLSLGLVFAGLLPATIVRAEVTAADHDWSQWRGPNRDGVSLDQGLIKKWPEDGPPLLYCFKGDEKGVGSGYCPPIIVGNHAYISGKINEDAYLMAYELPEKLPEPAPNQGRKQAICPWRANCSGGPSSASRATAARIPAPPLSAQAQSNNAPGRIYLTSGDGEIAGLDTSGKLLWVHSMKKDFDARIQTNGGYGFSESPLVDGDKVIVCPGVSDAVMVAYDKETGKLIWKATNPEGNDKDPASHCSVMISHACGIKQYVNNTGWGLIGVSPEGKFLWGYKKWAESSCNTPIVRGDYVFGVNAYGFGAILLKLVSNGEGQITPKVVYSLSAEQCQCLCGQAVLIGDCVYVGHGQYAGNPQCIDFLTGKQMWRGKQTGSGVAALISYDGMLIFRNESKEVLLVEATPKGYNLVSKFKPASARVGYSPPVVAHGLLYLRDRDLVMVYDLRPK